MSSRPRVPAVAARAIAHPSARAARVRLVVEPAAAGHGTFGRRLGQRPRSADHRTALVSKVLPLAEALRRHVPDGASVALGTALECLIPFAAAHELIRQERRDLTLVGPISDICFEQLIAAGCVQRVVAAWVGNVQHGAAYAFRRALEQGVPRPLEIEDHSNFSIALALEAAAQGVPYLPTRSLLGSDLLARNPRLRVAPCPFTGVPAGPGAGAGAGRRHPPRPAGGRGRELPRVGADGCQRGGREGEPDRDRRGGGAGRAETSSGAIPTGPSCPASW